MFDCAAGRASETATSAADIAAVKVTRMKASNRIRRGLILHFLDQRAAEA